MPPSSRLNMEAEQHVLLPETQLRSSAVHKVTVLSRPGSQVLVTLCVDDSRTAVNYFEYFAPLKYFLALSLSFTSLVDIPAGAYRLPAV